MYATDTIAAIATAPGVGAIGIVRVSGPRSPEIARRLVGDEWRGDWQSHRLYRVRIRDARDRVIDDALAVLMFAPNSYTGEDVLELHCHGSPALLECVLGAVLVHGARTAAPGEFTRRAFLNGRLDLTQAEAVLDLTRARSASAAALATDHLFGVFRQWLDAIRRDALRAKALLEVQIDFAEEEVAIDPVEVTSLLRESVTKIDLLLKTFRQGRRLREGISVTLAGAPNVGKSSLLNAFVGEERVIVTDIPGTTRDRIEESAEFDGVPVVLNDTAGLRPSEDPVERIGIARTRSAIVEADVVVLVVDGSRSDPLPDNLEVDPDRLVIAANKSDLEPALDVERLRATYPRVPIVHVSARTASGLDELRRAILDLDAPEDVGRTPLVSRLRHASELANARDCLVAAIEATSDGVPADLVTVDLQAALDHIATITGEITGEDVLDLIFGEFCLGK